MNQQLKTNSTKEWASNLNVKPIGSGSSNKPQIQQQGLTALVKVNGVNTYTCWESGSELNTISPDFTQGTGIKPEPKESTLRICLGTKGSSASTSYEVAPMLDFSNMKFQHVLDIFNLDQWDLLLGSPFCNQYSIVLDYETQTICFGNMVINALSHEEDAVICKGNQNPHLHVHSQ
jgi:hypothetical protein